MNQLSQKFEINERQLNKCKQFASQSVYSSLDKYAKRHGFDVNDEEATERAVSKFTGDIVIGKIGEEITHQKLQEKFPNLNLPDYNIYSVKEKSWDSDLKDAESNISIAVKSQDIRSALDNEESWVFQFGSNGKDSDKEIFNNSSDNHYVAMVSLNIPRRFGQIKAVVKLSWLHENNLFKPMKSQYLQSNKVAVYYEDLLQFQQDLFQL